MVLESEPRLVIRQDPKLNDDQEHKVNNKSAHCRSSWPFSTDRNAHGVLSPRSAARSGLPLQRRV